MKDRADPHAQERALEITHRDPSLRTSPERAAVVIAEVLGEPAIPVRNVHPNTRATFTASPTLSLVAARPLAGDCKASGKRWHRYRSGPPLSKKRALRRRLPRPTAEDRRRRQRAPRRRRIS